MLGQILCRLYANDSGAAALGPGADLALVVRLWYAVELCFHSCDDD